MADDDSTTRDEGQQLLDSLCHRGDPRACMVLADHLQNTDRPDDEIIATFERACDTGDRLGCRTLATHLIDHHRDDEHHTLIVDALEEHCHPGDTRNCDLLVSYFADRGDDLHTQSCRVYYQQLDMR